MVLKDKTGKQCSAVEVFKLSIKALMGKLKRKGDDMHDLALWVLIVPSACTDSAKQLIRESAEKVRFSKTYLHHSATKFQTH
jgi:hypothetical protein